MNVVFENKKVEVKVFFPDVDVETTDMAGKIMPLGVQKKIETAVLKFLGKHGYRPTVAVTFLGNPITNDRWRIHTYMVVDLNPETDTKQLEKVRSSLALGQEIGARLNRKLFLEEMRFLIDLNDSLQMRRRGFAHEVIRELAAILVDRDGNRAKCPACESPDCEVNRAIAAELEKRHQPASLPDQTLKKDE